MTEIGQVPGCFPFLWNSASLRVTIRKVSLSRRIKLLLLSFCLPISCATNINVNSPCFCEAFAKNLALLELLSGYLTIFLPIVMQSGSLILLKPSGPVKVCGWPYLYCQYWTVSPVRLFPRDSCVNKSAEFHKILLWRVLREFFYHVAIFCLTTTVNGNRHLTWRLWGFWAQAEGRSPESCKIGACVRAEMFCRDGKYSWLPKFPLFNISCESFG